MINRTHQWNISHKPLHIGLLLSILLTLAAYAVAKTGLVGGLPFVVLAGLLGGIQAFVQLVCFLHLGIEDKPHWNLITFLFALLVFVVIIGGSMWIMANLNYNTMIPMDG